MKPVDVLGGAVRVAGVVEMEPTASGLVLHRMPAWARVQHNDLALPLLEMMPAGGRLEMVTDATCLELDVQLMMLQLGPEPAPPATFDLVVDGELTDRRTTRTGTTIVADLSARLPRQLPVVGRWLVLRPTGKHRARPAAAVEVRRGGPETVRFEGLPAGEKRVEVWLPHAAVVHLIEMRADGAVAPPPALSKRKWTHYGSSISHCLEADRPTGTWPAIAARLADVDLQSFSFAGQCHLDPFAGRMIAEHPAELISMKLGINVVNGDTMRERTFLPALHGLLDTVRGRHPDVPLVLITPIICPVAERHPGPTLLVDGQTTVIERAPELAFGSLTLRRIRKLEEEIVTSRRDAGDSNLHLVQGTDLFGPDDVHDLPDGLHPNADGYRRMGERFHEIVFEHGPFAHNAPA